MKNTIKSNWPKFVLQWGVLAALIFFLSGLAAKMFPKMTPVDPEAYCPMGGLEALTTYLSRGSLPCSMSSLQIVMGLVLAAAVILFSKLFCAYICPIGTIEDLLMKARKAVHFKGFEIKVGSVTDKILRIFKYGLLFWIFYTTATASELFCKKMDPYYAVATGFKGEITLWMSIVSLVLVVVCGFLIKRFWCRYICPLGAASNTFKFWLPLLGLGAAYWLLSLCGLNIQWWWVLAAFCIMGYLLEILCGKPKFQLLHIVNDTDRCTGCGNCQKNCPYNIDIRSYGKVVNSVDCTLCGECVGACAASSLAVGVCRPVKSKWTRFIPVILTVALVVAGMIAGSKFELPTISETWDIEDGMKLETVKVEDLKSVKCYGSSMAFKARMQKVPGVHGVKTYVGSHTVVISYDPSRTNEEKILKEVFVPSHFRIWSPDPKKIDQLAIRTLRAEKMYDKMALNYLGLQLRTTGKSIFGVESEYDCPVIIHIYMSQAEADTLSDEWFKEIVNRKVLAMPVHGGGVKETPVDFEFVRMEKGIGHIKTTDYLEKMFDGFTAEFSGKYPSGDTTAIVKRVEVYKDKPQYIYEIADQNYEKPIIKRGLPFLSNHLSKEEGVIGVYLKLNKDYVPSLQVRYAAPMTADRIWELMTMETWTITYKADDVREESARMKFKTPGISYPYSE